MGDIILYILFLLLLIGLIYLLIIPWVIYTVIGILGGAVTYGQSVALALFLGLLLNFFKD